jgi:putative membrane protein insertion efficiency factor
MIPAKAGAKVGHALWRAPRVAARALVKQYRFGIAPILGMNCRHLPSCSEYAEQALARYGLWAGGWMTLARLLRCHPWGTSGLDFVPPERPAGARWYLPWRYARWRGTNSAGTPPSGASQAG